MTIITITDNWVFWNYEEKTFQYGISKDKQWIFHLMVLQVINDGMLIFLKVLLLYREDFPELFYSKPTKTMNLQFLLNVCFLLLIEYLFYFQCQYKIFTHYRCFKYSVIHLTALIFQDVESRPSVEWCSFLPSIPIGTLYNTLCSYIGYSYRVWLLVIWYEVTHSHLLLNSSHVSVSSSTLAWTGN